MRAVVAAIAVVADPTNVSATDVAGCVIAFAADPDDQTAIATHATTTAMAAAD